MQEKLAKKDKCSGCMACYNACPLGAIEIINNDGFYYPYINQEKCTNCGICSKACPIFNPPNASSEFPKYYACINNNENIRKKSSSGGIFYSLAANIINQGGYVCGCLFDENFKLKHIVSNSIEDVKKMQGSKYIQSYIGYCYSEIKNLLEKGNSVLFSGTPCQCAGLKSFLNKDYEKLIIVDLLCSCNNPPKMLEEYIKYEIGEDNKVTDINFRNKITGWGNINVGGAFSLSLNWVDKNNNSRCFYDPVFNNIFFKGFLEKLWMMNACDNCIYQQSQRYSDLTLGDFWGVWAFNKDLDDGKGLSFVMLSTQKGKEIFEHIKHNLNILSEIDENFAINHQPVISGQKYQKHKNHDLFFKYLPNHYSSIELTKDLLGINKVGILTYDASINFGAHLQAYALCETIKALGYSPKIIRWAPHYKDTLGYEDDNMKPFRDKYLPRGSAIYAEDELKAEIADCNRIIIGGDQVFRNWQTTPELPVLRYYGDFVTGSKVLASYGASFGIDFFNGDKYLTDECKKLIKRFDRIGVREKSGVKILNSTFGVNGEEVIDPVFLLDKKNYDNLVKNAHLSSEDFDYIAYMCLENELGLGKVNKTLKNNLVDYNLININTKNGQYVQVEEWINNIKNAKFVITDSFHCMAFCIISSRHVTREIEPFAVGRDSRMGITRQRVACELHLCGLAPRRVGTT